MGWLWEKLWIWIPGAANMIVYWDQATGEHLYVPCGINDPCFDPAIMAALSRMKQPMLIGTACSEPYRVFRPWRWLKGLWR